MIAEPPAPVIARPRVLARLSSSVAPVTILAAPAGFGKSIALREFLRSTSEPSVLFDAKTDSFEAILSRAEGQRGIVAVDGLDFAMPRQEARLLQNAIERSVPRVRWILCVRDVASLPVATWIAYGFADLIDRRDLAFTAEEASTLTRAIGGASSDDAEEIVRISGGWPAAVALSLRTGGTRELLFRLVSEQVYDLLDARERDLLDVASVLPTIDAEFLESAGFECAVRIIQDIRVRIPFLHEQSPSVFRIDRLFAEFLRHRVALAGAARQAEIHRRVACAYERTSDAERALASWVTAKSAPDVVRMLDRFGFDLVDRSRIDAVVAALRSLDERTRRERPLLVALRGLIYAARGSPARAEAALYRAALRARQLGESELFAEISIRLALIVANRGACVADILSPVAGDLAQSPAYRAEALSLIAAERARAGEAATARTAVLQTEELLPTVDNDATRARILQRLGVAEFYTGDPADARDRLSQAAELATELDLHSLASRAYAVLSHLMLHHFDDARRQLHYAELSAAAATSAGNVYDTEFALLQILGIDSRLGNFDHWDEIENRLASLRSSDFVRDQYVAVFRAIRLACDGHFDEAIQQLRKAWRALHLEAEVAMYGSQCALFLAIVGRRDEAVAITREACTLLAKAKSNSQYEKRYLAAARLFCAMAELKNNRNSYARRLSTAFRSDSDPVVEALNKIGSALMRIERSDRCVSVEDMITFLNRLEAAGYVTLSRIIEKAVPFVGQSERNVETSMTQAEVAVISLLADGMSTKEIAQIRTCSIYTVRVHIANAIAKLGASGRIDAITKARQVGVIS